MKIPIKFNLKKAKNSAVKSLEPEIPADRIQGAKKVEPWKKIAKIGIYLLIFLIPLFFLPWTFNILDFNKQALLGALVFIVLIIWILRTLITGRLEFNLSWLNIPIVILLLIYGLSTIFSLWTYGSFWGWPLNIGASFLTLLYFVFLYFLIANILKGEREIFWLLFFLVFSGFLATIFVGLQLFGKYILPWDFSKIASFNTIGTVNSLAIFLATLLPLAIGLMFIARQFLARFLFISALVMVFGLILINFRSAWLVLIAGLAILLIFSTFNIKKIRESKLLFVPIALLIIALFFITFRIIILGLPQTPWEVSPKQLTEVNIAKNSLSQSLIFGTGPGTFVYNYSKFKPKEVNQELFWDIRFDRGASEILDRLITTGILGLLSFLFVLGVAFWLGFKYLKNISNASWLLGLGIVSAFGGVTLSQFIYPSNLSLNLVFWILLASLAALEGKSSTFEIQPSSPKAVMTSFFLVLVLIFGTGLFFLQVQKWAAGTKYLQSQKFLEEGNLEQAIDSLGRAINLNSSLDVYWRDISQLYLIKTNETLQRRDLTSDEIASQAQLFIANSINSAKRAVDLNPANVANWSAGGFTYRNTIGLVGGVEDWALNFYQKAQELEPTNPYFLTEIGRVYLAKSDLLLQQEKDAESAENLKIALENFEKSLRLKSDYAPAHFLLAMISVREGRISQAIEKLESIKQIAPLDQGLAFQLGIIYYNDNQLDKAKKELERAVSLDENYSNARYFLGLIYDKEGNKKAAISQFEKIEKLNPDNEEIKKILSNLRAGKSALEGVLPAQPPIEEKPPERIEK